MAVNNNTTRLGTGFRVTARQFDGSPSASMISGEIARANYRALSKTDPKLAKLRQYVRKLVSTFPQADKMAILSEFGDPRRGTSDEAVVEALITNLKESELDVLVRDVMIDENNLSKKVRKIKADKKKAASKFSARTFEDVYSQVSKSRNPRQMRKALEAYDKSFKIPKAVVGQFGNLKREVEGVLKDLYNRVELSGLAIRMGISFDDDITQKQIVGMITNKVLLFVSLVTGKTKGGYANAIIDDSPYKEVLQYTSYSWAAGVVGKTSSDLASLQKQAREAKIRSKESFVQKDRPGMGFVPKAKRFAGGVAGGIKGGLAGAGAALGLTALSGPLGLASIPILTALGVLGGKTLGSGELRGDIRLQQEASATVGRKISSGESFKDNLDTMDTQQLFEEAAKYGLKPRKDTEGLKRDIRIQIEKKRIRIQKLEQEKAKASAKGRTFDKNRAAELAVLKSDVKASEGREGAVQTTAAGTPYVSFSLSSGPDLSRLNAAVPVLVVNSLVGAKDRFSDASKARISDIDREIGAAEATIASYKSSKNRTFAKKILGPDIEKLRAERASIESSELSRLAMAIDTKSEDDENQPAAVSLKTVYGGKSANASALMSEEAMSVKLSKRIKKEPVTPVYVVNKSVPTDTGQLLTGIIKALLNFVPFGGKIGRQLDALASGTTDVAGMIGLATGGTGRASGLARKTTHFISGDSLSKRPNPEQVSINWSDKSYSVKPIPQFADGGGQSASGQVRRMTPSERQEPMKVYAVNNSITEMVDVNGQSVSLIGLVSEMNGRLGTIEGLLAIGNRNSEAIVKSTSLTATGVGRLSSSQNASGSINPFAGGGFPSDLNPILSGV